jgi:hypothetical protein
MLKLTWRQAAARRVRRHHLDQRAPAGSMLAVASRLCGLHAQLMSSAEPTAWARIEDLDRGALQRALWEDRTLVKTWAMRGTLHLLPAGELPVWYSGASCHAGHLLPGDLRSRVFRPQGWISPVLLVNGLMHGVWSHKMSASRVEVVIAVRQAAGLGAPRG